MRVFILLCFCWTCFASSLQEVKEAANVQQSKEIALAVPEFQLGLGRKLSAEDEEAVGVWSEAWSEACSNAISGVVVAGAVKITNDGGNTIKVGNIIELKAIQIKKLIQIMLVGVKSVLGKATIKKAKWILSLVRLVSNEIVKKSKDARDFALADFALKFVWQAGFVLDVFKTLRNAAIAAAYKIMKESEKALEKIREAAKSAVNTVIKLIPGLDSAINQIRAYFGFDPWDGSPGYPDCAADGKPTKDACVCFVSTTGTSCDDGTGKGSEYICVPDTVEVCMPGEKCIASKCEIDVSEVKTDMETVDSSKKDALTELITEIVKYFATKVDPGTNPKVAKTKLGATMWKDTMILLGLPTSDHSELEMKLAAEYGLPVPAPAYEQEAKVAEIPSSAEESWTLKEAYLVLLFLPAMKIIYDYTSKKQTVDVEFDVEATLLE